YNAALVDNRPRFYRPDHTPIRPPHPPPPHPHPPQGQADPHPHPTRGSVELRHRHHQQGQASDRTTPGARSGGSPHWSPQAALDALLN
ncbi:MAG: hypothetical protein ACRDZN_16205, partial [Acidimicrobiales bacterium]